MSDDTKKNIAGALKVRPISEDRKPSSGVVAAAAATPLPLKKVIIKSADMQPDMQKEAVDIAVGVSFSLLSNRFSTLLYKFFVEISFWICLFLLRCAKKTWLFVNGLGV